MFFDDLIAFLNGSEAELRDRERRLQLYTHHLAVIVGCGGIGSWVGLLGSYVFKEIILIDHDIVELSNLHRTPYFACHVGLPKVLALAQLINLRNPNTIVHPINLKVDDIDIDSVILERELTGDTIVFDCRDSILPPIECKHGLVIRMNYDGFNYSIIFNPDYKSLIEWDDEPETAGYRITPSCQSVPVMLASFVLQLIQNTPPDKIPKLKDKHLVISGNINDLLLKIFKP